VAPELLGKVVATEVGGVLTSARIIETEAYAGDDPASHSFRGRTDRNAVMFGPAGRLYVYLSYGIHTCANVVTGAEGDGQAVLLRAALPVDGVDVVRQRRARRPDRELADGPGKLCQALGIELTDDGVDLTAPSSPIRILDDGTAPPVVALVGPRVGITKGIDIPWRFRVPAG
jgi:DNA-3-methyladenine glycosylase